MKMDSETLVMSDLAIKRLLCDKDFKYIDNMVSLEEVVKSAYSSGAWEGKQEGIAEGKAQGIAEGKAQGIAEGKAQGIMQVALNMKKAGMKPEEISGITGLTLEEINNLL